MPGGKLDKSNWPEGEWHKEPDLLEWSDGEYYCVIIRQPVGHLCGYIGFSILHNAYGKNLESLQVHGGVTYQSFDSPSIKKSDLNQHNYWIGFDCAHFHDFIPNQMDRFFNKKPVYRNIDYVKSEISSLIKQLDEYV